MATSNRVKYLTSLVGEAFSLPDYEASVSNLISLVSMPFAAISSSGRNNYALRGAQSVQM